MKRITQPRRWRYAGKATVIGALLVLSEVAAWAGTLSLGEPTVEDGQYVFPVVLQGESNVASLNFTLAYDASVFEPVAAEPGIQAVRGSKQVAANAATPGEFIVVVLGLNQTALASGEVVRIGLRPLGTPTGQTRLDLVDTSLASWEGPELPSNGTGRSLSFAKPGSKPDAPKAAKPSEAKNAGSGQTSGHSGRRMIWTVAEGTGMVAPMVLGPATATAAETGGQVPESKGRMSEADAGQMPGPDHPMRKQDLAEEEKSREGLTKPLEKSIVESESNRASIPDARRVAVTAGSKVGKATRGWTRWPVVVIALTMTIGMVILRKKLFS